MSSSRLPIFSLLFLCTLIINSPLKASETDQYMTWNSNLKDSADSYNRLIHNKLTKILKKANKSQKKFSLKKCRSMSLSFIKSLSEGPSLKRITKHDYQKKHRGEYPVDIFPGKKVSNDNYYLGSIHNKQKVTKMKELGRSFNVGGVYIGNDKMTHFAVIGASYYSKYLTKRKQGFSHKRALRYIMWRGFQKEASILGLKWGTFSFADLEANYQGFKIAYNLCESSRPHLIFQDEKYRIQRPIDIREYFTPNFDESFNRNYFRPYKLKKVVFAIDKYNYCQKQYSPRITKRFAKYQSKVSDLTSQKYAKKLLDISIRAEAQFPNLPVSKSYFPMTQRSQTFDRICNHQINYDDRPDSIIVNRVDAKIEACATKQAGFKIRGRILSKTRRDINAAITNFITYAQDKCTEKGHNDFLLSSDFRWVKQTEVSNTVPFEPYYIKKCLVADIRCI